MSSYLFSFVFFWDFDISFHYYFLSPQLSTIPDLDPDTMQTLKQLSRGETSQSVDDVVSINFHRDPTLIKRLSGRLDPDEPPLKKAATMEDSPETSPYSKTFTKLKKRESL